MFYLSTGKDVILGDLVFMPNGNPATITQIDDYSLSLRLRRFPRTLFAKVPPHMIGAKARNCITRQPKRPFGAAD